MSGRQTSVAARGEKGVSVRKELGKGKAFSPLPKPLVGGVAIKDASPGEKYGKGVAFVFARGLPRPALNIEVPGLIEVSGNTEISTVSEIKCASVVQSPRN